MRAIRRSADSGAGGVALRLPSRAAHAPENTGRQTQRDRHRETDTERQTQRDRHRETAKRDREERQERGIDTGADKDRPR